MRCEHSPHRRDGGRLAIGRRPAIQNMLKFLWSQIGIALLIFRGRRALRAGRGAGLPLADAAEEKMADVTQAARILGLVVHLTSVSVPPCN